MPENQAYSQFFQKRAVLEKIIRQQLAFFKALSMREWVNTINNLKERVESENFKVLVLGEFNAGKSTFINALLKKEILPSYSLPCTAIINEVKWGEKQRALLHYNPDKSGKTVAPEEIPINKIQDYVVINHSDEEKNTTQNSSYKKVEIFWDLELCKNGVEIIDSPGTNENEVRQQVTLNYLSQVDAILFVLTSDKLGAKSETDLVSDTLIKSGHQDIFFICNRFDLIREKEQKPIKQYGINKLAPLTKKGAKRVFFISAREALDGHLEQNIERVEKSGIIALEKELQEFLIHERGKIKLLRPAIELRRSIQEARRIIPERRALLQTSIQTLEKRYAEAEEPLQKLNTQKQQISVKVEYHLTEIKSTIKPKAEEFYRRLADVKIQEWMNGYKVQTSIAPRMLIINRKKVREMLNEITDYLKKQIESEASQWQIEDLQPSIEPLIETMIWDIYSQMGNFVKDINEVRKHISPDIVDSESSHKPSPVDTNRVILDVLEKLNDQLSPKGLIRNIMPKITAIIGAIALGILNPFILIPLILGIDFLQRFSKANNINNLMKDEITKEFIKTIRLSIGEQSEQLANAVIDELRKCKEPIEQTMTLELKNIEDQKNIILIEKKEGEANVQKKLEQLELIEKNMNQMDTKLDQFITEVTLG